MENIHENCPLCKKVFSSGMNGLQKYWFCNSCLLGRIKLIPEITYKEEYYISGSNILAKLFSPVARIFFLIRNSYSGFSCKKIWVDVGAGEGSYLNTVNAEKKLGVEISAAGRNIMSNNSLNAVTNNAFLKIDNLNADIISFWHVLEHLKNPDQYIHAAEKKLNKSGKIVIAVPNIDSFEFKIFGNYWFHLAPAYHIWFFSPRSLSKILKKNNLKIEKIDYWAPEHHLSGLLQSFINMTTGTDNILHRLIKRKQNLSAVTIGQVSWIIFWCSLGLPVVLIFWIFAALTKKSGAIVVVASKMKTTLIVTP